MLWSQRNAIVRVSEENILVHADCQWEVRAIGDHAAEENKVCSIRRLDHLGDRTEGDSFPYIVQATPSCDAVDVALKLDIGESEKLVVR